MKSLRCPKKINDIFRHKDIFYFSHLQFDGVRAQTDGSGMEDTKKIRTVTLKTGELFQRHTEHYGLGNSLEKGNQTTQQGCGTCGQENGDGHR